MKMISISRWVAAVVMLSASAVFAQVGFNIGTLLPNDKITITFDVTITNPFPANTFAVTNQATLTATGVGLSSDDPSTALINDPTITTLSVAPVITSCPPNVTTNTAPGTCTRAVAFAATAIGGDSPPVITYNLGAASIASSYTFNKGTNVVSVTASNGVLPNATCSFTVIVLDQEPPAINCPGNIATNTQLGQCFATVFYAVTNSDNCPGQVLTQTAGLASGAAFPKGTTTNRFTVTDASGNTNTCSFTVTVLDTENPTITCPGNILVSNTPGLCSAIVNYSITSTDNCPGQVLVQNTGLASGSAFPKGVTTNRWTVTDASGNTNTCSFTVTVIDAEKPVITCLSDIVTNTPDACTTNVVVTFATNATDNCALTNVVVTPPSGTAFPLGTNTVTASAWDSSGNTNTCSFKVVVLGVTNKPTLNIVKAGPNAVVSWTNIFPCYNLQVATSLSGTNNWVNYAGPLATNGNNLYATNTIGSNRFFRLKY